MASFDGIVWHCLALLKVLFAAAEDILVRLMAIHYYLPRF